MKHTVIKYVKKPQTIVAVVVALMAQIIFCVVWMTAYDGVLDRVNHLKVAIVNQDGAAGEALAKQLESDLPFEITELDQKQAADRLIQRDVHLIVTIPEKFGQMLQTSGTQAELTYTLNESNPQMTKSMMQTVVTQVTNEMNRNAALQGTQVVLQQLKLPADQASHTAQSLMNKVHAQVQNLNKVDGMDNQMVPMMLVLASYVGAMLMAMNIHQVAQTIGSACSTRQHFAVRALIILAAAAIISIAGSSLIAALGGQMASGFAAFWLFHFLTLVTFMFFAQMFLVVFGMAGMFLNMMVLSLSLVTSGTIVPKQLLSSFYQSLGQFLPATYSVEGIMNLQFGGAHTEKDVWMLMVTMVCSAAITAGAAAIKGRGKRVQAAAADRPDAANVAELSAH
ncbi:YhgE/Pip domain-containing protein [Paenibacillus aestuarii]|uniref:YhgE/Pip domain-containing protein n=1 Tax=Paenibacillus aestuarii TaxID=516965 RepID=A0ABW0K6M4_9BACL|nr:ABC transporter permease [Paenibacillus aestuarii]